ncbi:DUF2157 domain-containing protein [Kribbella sp. NPDC006257]|uniref:DUF2157 domain-containing protein n=1 Tax=Kribbella sp. NPDC006257 TaxID=3156738 RepID=UPI0033BDB256
MTANLRCPVCQTDLLLNVTIPQSQVAPGPFPHPQPAPPMPPLPDNRMYQGTYPPPPHRGIQPAATLPPGRPAARSTGFLPPAPPLARPRRRREARPPRRLSPQGTLLALGVLLLLAAGVTFLAVNWDSLSVSIQASIMATLAALALAGSVPASRKNLAGTAEALALLGGGLLIVDLFGARELGLVSDATISETRYAALSFAIVASINLLMTRIAPSVKTFGLTAVIAGQLPLTLFLVNHVSIAVYLLGLVVQVVVTVLWTNTSTRLLKITGGICGAFFLSIVLFVGTFRVLLGLLAAHSSSWADFADELFDGPITAFGPVLATAAVVCLATVAGTVLSRKTALSASLPPNTIEYICSASGAFVIAVLLPQIPVVDRWSATAAATGLGLAVILRPRRTGLLTFVLRIAAVIVASVNLVVCAGLADLQQLGLISAIIAGLAMLAAWRKHVTLTAATWIAGFGAQLAILFGTADGLLSTWTGGVALAVVGAILVGFACVSIGKPHESALLLTALSAVIVAELVILAVSPATGTGVVLTIAAAPLVAYGMQPRRRDALLVAGTVLVIANTAFVLGAGAATLEWFTLPPAVVMLAIGLLRWRDQPSWVYLGPGLLLGLVPSALVANSNHDFLRSTFVVAAAVAVMVIGTRFSLQAPFVIGATVLAKIGLWQFLEVAPLIPRWITLGAAGAILLAVGATYERRLQNAKQAARWISALH